MQLQDIKSFSKNKTKKRVGRGGKRGTFSGRGVKGQKSRSGRKLRPEWRDALKSIPKRRGYKFKGARKPAVFNLGFLNTLFKENEIVSPESLLKKNLALRAGGKTAVVKILGEGELKKKLTFKNLKISESAKEKIKKAGGTII